MTPELTCPERVSAPTLFDGFLIHDQVQLTLQTSDNTLRYLDGVFDTRSVSLAETKEIPFVGTRWKLIGLDTGLWMLACQGDPNFSLYALDGKALLGRCPDNAYPMRSMQWLLYKVGESLLLRSVDGYWIGNHEGKPFAAFLDDLSDTAFHWKPKSFW